MSNRSELYQALSKTLLDLCAIPSFIGEERALCDAVEARLAQKLGKDAIIRHRDSLIVHVGGKQGAPKIALVGHLDTVRSQHDAPARIEGELLYGAGAADMKSGLAVMIELAERLDLRTLPCDLYLVFYEREEGPFVENVLGELLEKYRLLHSLDLAVCLEPSDNKLQLGCMGSLQATVIFQGRTAHSARPWQGENAFYKSIPFLQALQMRAPHDVTLDGLIYREVISPTLVQGGRSRNIIPDRMEFNVNYRFAPGRSVDNALADLKALAGEGVEVFAADAAPAGKPHGSHPLVEKLKTAGVQGVEPKQAWTDVARFDQIGVVAVNFGPGTQAQAHQRNEYTVLPLLEDGYRIVERFLTTVP